MSSATTWGKKRRTKPEDPPNIVKKVKPSKETEEKTLAVRQEVAKFDGLPKGIKAIEAYVKKMAPKGTPRRPSLLKKSIKPQKAMALLDDTFEFVHQHPPIFFETMGDPFTAFLMDIDEKVAEWPQTVLKKFLEELASTEPPDDVPGLIGEAKRLISDIFDDIGANIARPYLTRWKLWPYKSSKPRPEVDPKKENLMASKMATKKKVTSKKGETEDKKVVASAEKAEKTEKTGKAKGANKPAKTGDSVGRRVLGEESTLKPGKNMPSKGIYGQLLPLIPKAGITLAALVKAAATKIKFPASKVRRYAAGAVREGFAVVE